jgi:hypothetical protein
MSSAVAWPELPLAAWSETRDTLHLWTQIVGKIRLVQTPWINHSWNTTLYVTSRGLTTSLIPYDERIFQIDFDFIDHAVLVTTVEGDRETVMLRPRTVASFYQELAGVLKELELPVTIHPHAAELPGETIDLTRDTAHESYDPDYAQRFWRALTSSHRVFQKFRSTFLGKASPVHFFWGSFDLSLALFSGKAAAPQDMKMPHMPVWVSRDASNQEQAVFGFWPGTVAVARGDGGVDPAVRSGAKRRGPRRRAARIPGGHVLRRGGPGKLGPRVARAQRGAAAALISIATIEPVGGVPEPLDPRHRFR